MDREKKGRTTEKTGGDIERTERVKKDSGEKTGSHREKTGSSRDKKRSGRRRKEGDRN